MRRWFSFPAIVFLFAGLLNGGADLPRIWGLIALGVPLGLLILLFLRPTQQRWRLAFGSFCLLIVATAVFDLSVAVPRGLPPLSASAAMVALFTVQFGVPAWLLWLAKPRGGQLSDSVSGTLSNRAVESDTGPGSTETSKRIGVPPNNPLQPPVGGLGGDGPPRWAFARRG